MQKGALSCLSNGISNWVLFGDKEKKDLVAFLGQAIAITTRNGKGIPLTLPSLGPARPPRVSHQCVRFSIRALRWVPASSSRLISNLPN